MRGASLIELLVAVAIALVISAAGLRALVEAADAFAWQPASTELSARADALVQLLTADLAAAGAGPHARLEGAGGPLVAPTSLRLSSWLPPILPRVVGLSSAADLLLSGRIFTGREAAERGLASVALPAAEVLPAAVAWAADVAANAAPTSVAAAKRLLWDDVVGPIERVGRLENRMFTWAGHQPDAKEGVVAFLEKRDPVWSNSMDDLPVIE